MCNQVIHQVASALYLSGCLRFGSFKIKSGATSPYYIDLSRVLSAPQQMCNLVDVAVARIKQIDSLEKIDKVASIELKGALIVPSIACELNMPCVIVRKEEKAYGVTGRIAGAEVVKGDNVLFFDDVISEGLSKVEGIKTLQNQGATVTHILVVVNREQGGKEKLEKLGYTVHYLAKISDIVSSLYENNYVSKDQADAVLEYIKQFNTE